MKQIKQINSLRGIGILLVISFHWFLSTEIKFISMPPLGVDIFFVLSGFFITGLLLDGRNKAEEQGFSRINVFKLFLVNRALRIFPIYYLTIFAVLLIPHTASTQIRHDFVYYLTYTSNFNIYYTHHWDEILCHLWSLAVEEQFYLLWPFVILLTNKKYLVHAICLFMAIGFVSQLFAHNEFDIVLPFQCFDALGVGALISWINLNKPEYLKKTLYAFGALIILAFIYYFIGLFAGHSVFFPDSTPSFAAAWLIAFVLLQEKKSEATKIWLLNNRFLMFLGRISYGLYLYHLIIPYFSYRLMKRFDIYDSLRAAMPHTYFKSLLNIGNFALLVLIAWLSWKYIEKPILNLRRYFQRKTETAPGLAVPNKRFVV